MFTKEVYKSTMSSLLTPPKVELKFPLVNFPELVYGRMNSTVLETRQRDVSYAIIHGLYKNRDRLFQQHRADDPLCSNQACKIYFLFMLQSKDSLAMAEGEADRAAE